MSLAVTLLLDAIVLALWLAPVALAAGAATWALAARVARALLPVPRVVPDVAPAAPLVATLRRA
jgi:hypothetical protein